MSKQTCQPTLDLTIRTGDGAKVQSKGPCSERLGYAIYMLTMLGDKPGTATPVQAACTLLLDLSEAALVKAEQLVDSASVSR